MMYWGSYGAHWWANLLMGASMLVFWGLVIAGVVVLVRYYDRMPYPSRPLPARPTPDEILAKRFARGELDEDEYQRRRDTLRAARQESPDGDLC
jgi:putative membrane protein